ncbi:MULTISPECIES: hypothetical protein [unclassified Methylobacterium]|uniref:hypothetical protein n=1 Tax=unclassified Methylobacterium TaxID=2615210 RepID=UPI00034AF402|nr:hypothetical protein [Methylobacterium sp. B34]
MTIFQVRQARSRAIVWTGEAESADRALEAAAQSAGYHTFAEMPDALRTDMAVEAVTV